MTGEGYLEIVEVGVREQRSIAKHKSLKLLFAEVCLVNSTKRALEVVGKVLELGTWGNSVFRSARFLCPKGRARARFASD